MIGRCLAFCSLLLMISCWRHYGEEAGGRSGTSGLNWGKETRSARMNMEAHSGEFLMWDADPTAGEQRKPTFQTPGRLNCHGG